MPLYLLFLEGREEGQVPPTWEDSAAKLAETGVACVSPAGRRWSALPALLLLTCSLSTARRGTGLGRGTFERQWTVGTGSRQTYLPA